METLLICLVTVAASGLTLFSGFGLGTILTPAFVVFFPVEVAVAMTALVHFANNLLKLGLFWRASDRATVVRFGLPALAASFVGARTLLWLSDLAPLAVWHLGSHRCEVSLVKLVVAGLMAGFAWLELSGAVKGRSFDRRWQPLGGVVSGFFGGLSGNQGAFRSTFLAASGLSKEAFIATGVTIACLVDVSRLAVYARLVASDEVAREWPLLLAATLSAFAGVFLGRRLLGKTTMRGVRLLVAWMLFALAVLLGSGII